MNSDYAFKYQLQKHLHIYCLHHRHRDDRHDLSLRDLFKSDDKNNKTTK